MHKFVSNCEVMHFNCRCMAARVDRAMGNQVSLAVGGTAAAACAAYLVYAELRARHRASELAARASLKRQERDR
jgi:hypothetical protein